VLATNTSSLKLEDMRTVLQGPERLVGIHFFNPVAMMPLVEVVAGESHRSRGGAEARRAFVRQDRQAAAAGEGRAGLPGQCRARPLHERSHEVRSTKGRPETIDAAMLAFGMPMGPIELADTVGLDIALAAGKQLAGAAHAPACLLARVDKGLLGKKSGQGFYTWIDGKAKKSNGGAVPDGLAERLVKPLIDRVEQLVTDGVVADPELADAGVIFGTGFAPFTPVQCKRRRVSVAGAERQRSRQCVCRLSCRC
jgi:3-hydroxyacyl-CoA dehydrogenase/enoyl-CoA hydratase/3-hydroxybutyryl-CoA epimerase